MVRLVQKNLLKVNSLSKSKKEIEICDHKKLILKKCDHNNYSAYLYYFENCNSFEEIYLDGRTKIY